MPRTPEQNVYFFWKYSIDAMGFFDMPKSFKASIELNKYDRFTGYVEELFSRMIMGSDEFNRFDWMELDRSIFPVHWWDTAIKMADGKNVKNPIPPIRDVTQDHKSNVFEAIIPAYRAIRESFENRHWYEWIFNHSQYVTERDSLKALKGLMTALVGVTQEEIDAAVATHISAVPSSGVSEERRRREIESNKYEKIEDIKDLRDQRLYGRGEFVDVLKVLERKYKEPILNQHDHQNLDESYNFEDVRVDEAIDEIEDVKSELDMGKERVAFENDEFSELVNQIGNEESIFEKNEDFFEKDDDLINDINALQK